jgi:hypothetical protein
MFTHPLSIHPSINPSDECLLSTYNKPDSCSQNSKRWVYLLEKMLKFYAFKNVLPNV